MMAAELAGNAGAPSTVGELLHAVVRLDETSLARMLALENGRHPTLAELQDALGDALDFDVAVAAGRAALGDADAATDPTLAAALDAAYRALESPRLVRAEITAASIQCWREPAPILLVEEEPLTLIVMADNRTGATVEFSAESHGEGVGGLVEAGRTGSSPLALGALPVGKYLVPLLLVAGGRPHTVDLPIECSAKTTRG